MTLNELLVLAGIVKDETGVKANTHSRIGLLFEYVINFFQGLIDGILTRLSTAESTLNDKGIFASSVDLQAAYPVGKLGWFAFLRSSNTTWIWNAVSNTWVDSTSDLRGSSIKFIPQNLSTTERLQARTNISAISPEELSAVLNDTIGSISYNAIAPTPGRSGKMTFLSGSDVTKCSWITKDKDGNDVSGTGGAYVSKNDTVIIVHDPVEDTYKYEHIKNSEGYATVAEVTPLKKYGNEVWRTYGDESTLDNLFNGSTTRRTIYAAVRWAQFINCDSTVPRTIRILWNGYAGFFRIIVSAYSESLDQWGDEFDTGNLAIDTVNPTHSAIISVEKTITVGIGGRTMKLLIDTSILTYPFVSGSELNSLASTPEWVFSPKCYELSDQLLLPKGQKPQLRMYPNTKLPVVSFQFDDNHVNDADVVALFDEYGVKCNFAFISGNLAASGNRYLGYQRKGFGICSHSVDSVIFNTSNYTAAAALAALQKSKNDLEKAGFIINGFVAPSSQLHTSFIESVRNTYNYAFTYLEGSAPNLNANPCNLVRESMEAETLAYAKGRVDNAIAWKYSLTFYGHSANFGTVNGTSGEMWDIAKLRALLEYVIAKRDAGLIFLGTTDECMSYYYASGPLTTAGINLKRGTNGKCGTFVANGTTPVTINNTSIAITDTIIISLNTVGGTVGALPVIKTITAGTGFTIAATAGDSSTYNYAIISNVL